MKELIVSVKESLPVTQKINIVAEALNKHQTRKKKGRRDIEAEPDMELVGIVKQSGMQTVTYAEQTGENLNWSL